MYLSRKQWEVSLSRVNGKLVDYKDGGGNGAIRHVRLVYTWNGDEPLEAMAQDKYKNM